MPKGNIQYKSTAAALRAKTERLKALRLARDAAAPEQEPAPVKPKAKKKSKGGPYRTGSTDRPKRAAAAERTVSGVRLRQPRAVPS